MSGRMGEFMKANGATIRCTEKEFLIGLTVVSIKETIRMIRSKALGHLNLKTEEFMKGNG